MLMKMTFLNQSGDYAEVNVGMKDSFGVVTEIANSANLTGLFDSNKLQ